MADNQQGNAGLSFPNGLGVQFSLSQVRGGAAPAPAPPVTEVTLTQNGDLIYATPGNTYVDIGQTTTGLNVEYVSQMGGTTFINSPAMINGNVVIPHPYNFSVNPENNPSIPTITMNGNVSVGGANSLFEIGSNAPIESVHITASNISLIGSPITVEGNSGATITVDGYSQSNIDIHSPQAINLVAPYVATLTSSIQTFSSNAIDYVASNRVTFTTSNFSTATWNTAAYSSNIYSNYCAQMFLQADGGINPALVPTINIISENGTYGDIRVKAKAGLYDLGLGGNIKMEAFGAGNPFLGVGGLININAYSGDVGDYGGVTSRVSLNAATITIGAGAVPTTPGLAGSMNLYGQGLISIVSALFPPIAPQIPETVYMYGNLGVRLQTGSLFGVDYGIQMLSDTYAGNIYPVANGGVPLVIAGRTNPTAGVQIKDVEFINMVSPNGYITGVSSINALSLNNPRDISNLSTINGQPYISAGASNWALYNQVSSLSSITATVGVLSTLITPSISGVGGSLSFGDTVVNKIQNLYVNNYSLLPIADVSSLFAVTIRANNISDTNAGAGPPLLVIDHVSTLNGGPYLPAQLWSQAPAVQDINANGANINNANTVYANTARLENGLTILNPATTVQFGGTDLKGVSSINGQPIASSSPNLTLSTLAVSSITGIGGAVVSFNGTVVNGIQNLYVNNTIQAPTIASYTTDLQIVTASSMTVGPGPGAGGLALINLSSINGAPYTGGGSSWNGQATTDLNMYLFNIINATSIGTVSITANGAITAGGTVTGNYVNSSNSMSAVSFNTAGIGVNANAINIGSAYFNSNAVSVAELSNLYSINGFPYINSGILQNGQLVLVDDGSAAPVTVVPFGGRAAGMYYLTSAVRTGGRDFHAEIQFTRPGPPENGYNFGYGGQYWFFNNNGSGGNQIYVVITFVLSAAPGDVYRTTEVYVPAGYALTFYMVPIPTGFGLATNWAKIGCIDYKVIPITPIY